MYFSQNTLNISGQLQLKITTGKNKNISRHVWTLRSLKYMQWLR